MKLFSSLVFGILFISTLYSETLPSLDSILQKYYAANGDLAALNNIKSIRISGVLQYSGGQSQFMLIKKRPNKMRMIIQQDPLNSYIKAFNGKQVWESSSKSQSKLLNIQDEKNFIRDSALFSHLIHLKDNSATLTLLGKSDVETFSCYHLILTLPNEDPIEYFIDDTEFLERKISYQNKDQWIQALFKDYKKVGPLKQPFKIEQSGTNIPKTTLNIHSIDLNIGVLNTYFDPPKAN